MKNMKPQHIKIILYVFEPNSVYATSLMLPTLIKSENQIDIFKNSTSLSISKISRHRTADSVCTQFTLRAAL